MSTKDKGYSIDVEAKKKSIKKTSSIDVIVAPTNEGRMTPIKNGLMEIIAGADPQLLPQDTHVRADWKILESYLEDNYTVVSVRLGNVDMTERVYGRQIGGQMRGHYVTYAFSAHVWAEKSYQLFDEGADEHQTQARLASELADKIIDVLEQYNGDTVSGICWFHNITARESEPERGPQRLTRIIVTGFIIAQRPLT